LGARAGSGGDDIDAKLAAHREGCQHAAAVDMSAPPAAPRRGAATQAALFAE
jgi:hypothetical protein